MQQPSIYFSGFTLHEPVTSITNLLLSLFCLAMYFKVGKSHAKYWPLFFASLSFATFFGALGHGLYLDKNNILQLICRIFGIVSVLCASVASIYYLRNRKMKLFLNSFAVIQFFTALILIILFNTFTIVKWNGVIGMGLIVAGINFYLTKKGDNGSIYIFAGVIINAIAGIFHSLNISFSKWFNHNDFSHVIILIGFYCMAIGAVRLQHYATV